MSLDYMLQIFLFWVQLVNMIERLIWSLKRQNRHFENKKTRRKKTTKKKILVHWQSSCVTVKKVQIDHFGRFAYIMMTLVNYPIIQINNNVLWDWQFYAK